MQVYCTVWYLICITKKSMKTFLVKKQTVEEKRANEFARYQFIMAMMNLDERMIGLILKKDCRFLDNRNNWQLLHWLKGQFSKLNPHMFHSKFEESISLDYYPGSDIFEFYYAPIADYNNDGIDTNEDQGEVDVFKSKMAFNIKLVLLFEEGKIADIKVPQKAVCLEKIRKFQNEN